MWISNAWQEYELIDASAGDRLEKWENTHLFAPTRKLYGIRKNSIRFGKKQTQYIHAHTQAEALGVKTSSQANGQ